MEVVYGIGEGRESGLYKYCREVLSWNCLWKRRGREEWCHFYVSSFLAVKAAARGT